MWSAGDARAFDFCGGARIEPTVKPQHSITGVVNALALPPLPQPMAALSYTAGSAVFEGRRNYQEDRVLVLPDFAKSSATPAQLRRVRRALPPGRCGGVDVLRDAVPLWMVEAPVLLHIFRLFQPVSNDIERPPAWNRSPPVQKFLAARRSRRRRGRG